MSKYKPGPFAKVFINFWDSISPRRMFPPAGQLIGQDPFGNKYYEVPADPRRGKRTAKRWYETPNHMEKEPGAPYGLGYNTAAGFDAKLPAEWESWLRYRRDDSPSDHEVIRSLALADLKKRNAAELDEKRLQEKLAAGETVTEPQPMDHEKAYYPKYKEYEIMPGEGVNNEDRWKDYKNPYAKEHK